MFGVEVAVGLGVGVAVVAVDVSAPLATGVTTVRVIAIKSTFTNLLHKLIP